MHTLARACEIIDDELMGGTVWLGRISAATLLGLSLLGCGSRSTAQPTSDALPHGSSACGRLPSEAIRPQQWPSPERWARRPECERVATVWASIPHEHRVCRVDQDCVGVARLCYVEALNRTAATRPEYRHRPCADPAMGECPSTPPQAVCQQGCCMALPL